MGLKKGTKEISSLSVTLYFIKHMKNKKSEYREFISTLISYMKFAGSDHDEVFQITIELSIIK